MDKVIGEIMRKKVEELTCRPVFKHIPNIWNQRRLAIGFDDTSGERVDLREFANPHGRRQCQEDGEYKLKVYITNFSGNVDIEGFIDWLVEVH